MVSKRKKTIAGIKPADKPGIALLALKRPPAANEKPVSDDAAAPLPVSSKPSIEVAKNTDVVPLVEAVAEPTQPDPDPLIGSQIEVKAPWGAKVFAEICGVYHTPGGDKWVCFNAIDEIPDGWMWKGGVKLISS